ncbi:DNA internalization-related competence protein ComEC/Rec2 [Sulfuriferula sp. AH1]|uniref:DNA internalization-related competence protein ComEC/Rec2 n=1 Tax=Sulfuriferula sp. AH1 TaxID=1985873 RepID=UPI000B3B50B0|nr:DNA internalization-related competence protein ComEC/Rec2 [Sulfuriferula sp. AH1]ARU31718.1 DNA internalization-related competence protein ComEC/Rec2 [Sulfuriferula sp. AH1]
MRLAVLAFVAGVMCLQLQAALPDLAWAWGLPLLASAWGLPKEGAWRRVRGSVLLGFWFALGFFYTAGLAQQRLADALPSAWEGVDVAVVGVVAGLPVTTERGQRFGFDIERVLTPGAVVPQHVQLSTYRTGFNGKPLPDALTVHAAQRWQLTVRLRRPHATQNPHVMDMEAQWFAHDIRTLGMVRERSEHRLLTVQVAEPHYLVEAVREHIAARFDRVLADAPYAGVLKALAIGDQSAIPSAQWQLYQRTGITHLISISGLHVTMLSGLAFALCYALWRRSTRLTLWLPARRAAVLIGALAALAYVVLAGFGVPAQRTLYMLWVVAIALWTGRTLAPTRILAWALLVVVLIDPWAVLAAGFWLSFGAVAVLLFATGSRVGEQHWLREWWQTQWAVTLALAPILLLLFGQLSTVSPLANAFAIPLLSFLITPLALLGSFPGMDAPLHWAHALMAACVWLLQMLAHWPMWQQAEPGRWAVGLALLGALWWLMPRGFPARWLGAVWMLPALLVTVPQPVPGAIWISAIDVGQGLAVLVRTAHHALLFDAGPRYNSEADSGSRIIAPYLRGEGITRLDRLVLSHDDNDHTGGAASILGAMPVAAVMTSLPATHPVFDHYAQSILRCEAGQSWDWDGVHFAVLHPTAGSYADNAVKDNHRSCVLKLSSAGGSVLLPADIEAKDEIQLLATEPAALRANLLIAPHHGSRTSSIPEFIAAVQPAMTVFTVGYNNRFGHPRSDVVARYRDAGSQLFRSDADGLVNVRFTPDAVPEVSRWRRLQQHYWQDS